MSEDTNKAKLEELEKRVLLYLYGKDKVSERDIYNEFNEQDTNVIDLVLDRLYGRGFIHIDYLYDKPHKITPKGTHFLLDEGLISI